MIVITLLINRVQITFYSSCSWKLTLREIYKASHFIKKKQTIFFFLPFFNDLLTLLFRSGCGSAISFFSTSSTSSSWHEWGEKKIAQQSEKLIEKEKKINKNEYNKIKWKDVKKRTDMKITSFSNSLHYKLTHNFMTELYRSLRHF